MAAANLIPGGGSHIFQDTKATGIQNENGYAITTDKNYRVKAPNVVIATHYPFYDDNNKIYPQMQLNRSYAIGVTINGEYPGGVYVTTENPGRSFRSTPLPDGRELILVVGEHHIAQDDADVNVHYENLLDTANSVFDVDEVLYHWLAQDYITPDKVPYIGNLSPDTPGVYVATGFRKWGITTAVAAATALTDSINGRANPWITVFEPSRSQSNMPS